MPRFYEPGHFLSPSIVEVLVKRVVLVLLLALTVLTWGTSRLLNAGREPFNMLAWKAEHGVFDTFGNPRYRMWFSAVEAAAKLETLRQMKESLGKPDELILLREERFQWFDDCSENEESDCGHRVGNLRPWPDDRVAEYVIGSDYDGDCSYGSSLLVLIHGDKIKGACLHDY